MVGAIYLGCILRPQFAIRPRRIGAMMPRAPPQVHALRVS